MRARAVPSTVPKRGNNAGQCVVRRTIEQVRGCSVAGRKEVPLQADGTACTDLALRLRGLRTASNLTYDQLALLTHYSKTTLQKACNGKEPPSWYVLERFVTACGRNAAEWKPLLEAAVAGGPAVDPDASDTDGRSSDIEPGQPAEGLPVTIDAGRQPGRRLSWMLGAAVAVVVSGALWVIVSREPSMVAITGRITCSSGANLVGVWIESGSKDTSGRGQVTGNTPEGGTYRAVVPAGTTYSVHAGCGGDATAWKVSGYSTETIETSTAWICDDTTREATTPPFHTTCVPNG
jgi:transcriptional regulator with XRE-family HTH domain